MNEIPLMEDGSLLVVYEGRRLPAGQPIVLRNGKPFVVPELKFGIRFEWADDGERASRLARALIYDALGRNSQAIAVANRTFVAFKYAVVACLDYRGWRITSCDVVDAIGRLGVKPADRTSSLGVTRIEPVPSCEACVVSGEQGRPDERVLH